MESCPECGSEKVEVKNEGMFCKKCGLLIEQTYFSGRRVV